MVLSNKSKTTDEPKCNTLLTRADVQYPIISVQQHTLTIDGNGVQKTIYIHPASAVPTDNTKDDVSDKRDIIGGKIEISENEYQATEGKVAEGNRCDTDVNAHLAPAAGRNIDAQEPRDSKYSHVNDNEFYIRGNVAKRIVGHTQKNGKPGYVVRCYRYTSKHHTEEVI